MIRHIEYKGKKYPILISFFALSKTEEETGQAFGESAGLKEFEILFYYALVDGADYAETEMSFTREKSVFVLSACFKQFKALVPEFMAQMSESKEGETIEDSKKKE
jgi:hypothetical protein